jgi:hypothetical protein
MALEDRYGLPLSTSSPEAASAYREGVDLMLAGWTGTAETLERAIALDPDFALPHIARARVHGFYQQGDLARQKAALARELVAKRGTERERSHVETLALAIEGRLPEAIAATMTHVEAWPRDALVLSLPLGALEHGDAARALAIYADVLQPQATQAPPLNVVTDAASLLWRLSAYGHAVPRALWVEGDATAQKMFPKSSLPFADIHMALFAAATQNREALAARLAVIEQRLADGKLPAGRVVPAVCRALAAFADEDYAACVQMLAPVLSEVVRLGGSHAQRELIEDTFIVALTRSGELPRARTLLDARLHRRPSLRDTRWQAAMG